MPGTPRSAAELEAYFDKGDTPSKAEFRDLIASILLADYSNWPTVLPAADGSALTNLTLPDPLPAIDGSALLNINPDQWTVASGFSWSIVDSTNIVLSGDQTAIYLPGRRLRLTLDTGTLYTEVVSAVYSGGTDSTNVELADDMGAAATLTAPDYGVITSIENEGVVSPGTIGLKLYGTALTAAATLSLVDGYNSFEVDGATGITAISSRPAGQVIRLKFNASPLITHHATNLILRYGSNWTPRVGEILELESTGIGTWRELMRSPDPVVYGSWGGAKISNDADADHDINIAPMQIADSTKTKMLRLAAEITKQIDAFFSAGDDAGGMAPLAVLTGTFASSGTTVTGTGSAFTTELAVGDVLYSSTYSEARRITGIASDTSLTVESAYTGAVAGDNVQKNGLAPNTTYHLYAIEKDSDGTVDVYFDPDPTVAAVGIPTGYTAYRRIASLPTNSSSNLYAILQIGRYFLHKTVPQNWSGSWPTSATLREFTVPTGIRVRVHGRAYRATTSGGIIYIDPGDVTSTGQGYTIRRVSTEASTTIGIEFWSITNTSGQLYTAADVGVSGQLWTIGWEDIDL